MPVVLPAFPLKNNAILLSQNAEFFTIQTLPE